MASTGRAIQVAVTHTFLAVAAGAAIETFMPPFTNDAALMTQVFETIVQVGLNGAVVAALAPSLQRDDPTVGIPFSSALYQSQPGLAQRISSVASAAKQQAHQSSQKMGLPAVVAA